MSMRRVSVLVVAMVASLSLTGCLSPYLKQASDAPAAKPSAALVTGLNVRFDSSGEKSLVDAAVDAAQNARLEEFGKDATELLEKALAEHGYTPAYDGARTSKLDLIQLASSAGTAALTGTWRHPKTSHWSPDGVNSLFVKPGDVIGKITVNGQNEYFVFAEVIIRDTGMFMKSPFVVVRASIYDQTSRKVLDLQGLGEGDSRFMFADRSPINLRLALQRGFESLKAVPVQPL
jgi:hypothetical protein